jgi:hypothetical protein
MEAERFFKVTLKPKTLLNDLEIEEVVNCTG